MELISINIGEEQEINAKSGKTGIYKQPVSGSVAVTELGLPGDFSGDVEYHAGVDQALYLYGQPDYDWWEVELNRELPPGTFGENLTISDFESAPLCIGDQLQVGEVVLQITLPRIPCVTLATRMGDPQFVKRFFKAERFGVYCRVLKTGRITAGDPISLTPYKGTQVSIIEVAHTLYGHIDDQALLRRFLDVPIAIRARNYYEGKLAEILAKC